MIDPPGFVPFEMGMPVLLQTVVLLAKNGVLPNPVPDVGYTMPFLLHAAAPAVVEHWKQEAGLTPSGGSPARLSLQLPG